MDFSGSLSYWNNRLANKPDTKQLFSEVEKATTLEQICEKLESAQDIHTVFLAIQRLIKRDADRQQPPQPPAKRARTRGGADPIVFVPETDDEEEEEGDEEEEPEESEEEEDDNKPVVVLASEHALRKQGLLTYYSQATVGEMSVTVGHYVSLCYATGCKEGKKQGVAEVLSLYRKDDEEDAMMEVAWCWSRADLFRDEICSQQSIDHLRMSNTEMAISDMKQADVPIFSITRVIGPFDNFMRAHLGRFKFDCDNEELVRNLFDVAKTWGSDLPDEAELQMFCDFLSHPMASIESTRFWGMHLASVAGIAKEIGTVANPNRKRMRDYEYSWCVFKPLSTPRTDKCGLCGGSKHCKFALVGEPENPVGIVCKTRASIMHNIFAKTQQVRCEDRVSVEKLRVLLADFLKFVAEQDALLQQLTGEC